MRTTFLRPPRVARWLGLASLACALVACALPILPVVTGSGNVIEENRDVTGFMRVVVHNGIELQLTQGTPESFTLAAEDNLLPYIESTVAENVLTLRVASVGNFRNTKPIIARLTVPNLDAVDLHGGSALLNNEWAGEMLVFNASGGSSINIGQMQANRASFALSGGSSANVAGQVATLQLTASGGSEFRGLDLEAQAGTLTMSGGSAGTVWVEEDLVVTLSGGSSVHYYGKPAVRRENGSVGYLTDAGER